MNSFDVVVIIVVDFCFKIFQLLRYIIMAPVVVVTD